MFLGDEGQPVPAATATKGAFPRTEYGSSSGLKSQSLTRGIRTKWECAQFVGVPVQCRKESLYRISFVFSVRSFTRLAACSFMFSTMSSRRRRSSCSSPRPNCRCCFTRLHTTSRRSFETHPRCFPASTGHDRKRCIGGRRQIEGEISHSRGRRMIRHLS